MKALAIAASVFFVGAGAWAVIPQSRGTAPVPATQAAVTIQQAGPSGPFVQTSPGANPTQIIHCQIQGTPNPGTFVLGQGLGTYPQHIFWLAEFRQGPPESTTRYGVWVVRDVLTDGSIHWKGGITYGTIGSVAGGACTGYPDGAGGFITNDIPLNGPDFNVSGTGQFVGNPAYGGGGNVTLTVSP